MHLLPGSSRRDLDMTGQPFVVRVLTAAAVSLVAWPLAADPIRTRLTVIPAPDAYLGPPPFGPWSLFEGDRPILGFEQPIGHEIISHGDRGYEYRPIFADQPAEAPSRFEDVELEPAMNSEFDDLSKPISAWDQAAADFFAGEYDSCCDLLDQADDDEPGGLAELLKCQAHLARRRFTLAAAALRAAVASLPPEAWAEIVADRESYYPNDVRYLGQLRALEVAVQQRPDWADGRLLLGHQYGSLGYARQAAYQLGRAARLAPSDDSALRMRQHYQRQAESERERVPARRGNDGPQEL